MGRVVALMDDLFFQMKVAETAKHLGLEFKVAANGEVLAGMLEPPTSLVIVDLNSKSEPVATIARLRATNNPQRTTHKGPFIRRLEASTNASWACAH